MKNWGISILDFNYKLVAREVLSKKTAIDVYNTLILLHVDTNDTHTDGIIIQLINSENLLVKSKKIKLNQQLIGLCRNILKSDKTKYD